MSTDFVTLTCPSCGGKLQITSDVERFACMHCGNEHVVRRGGGVISLQPVMDGLRQVQASTDRVASELTLQRLTQELAEAQSQVNTAAEQLKQARIIENRFAPFNLWTVGAVVCALGVAGAVLFTALGAGTHDITSCAGVCVVGLVVCGFVSGMNYLQYLPLHKKAGAAAANLSQAQANWLAINQQRDQARAATGQKAV